MGGLAAALCAMAFGLLIVGFIGGIVLRAACALYNKLASDPAAKVAEPNFLPAAGIVVATAIVHGLVGSAVGFAIGAGFGQRNPLQAQMLANAVGLPLSIIVMATLLSATLPTTFLRALAIAGLYILIGIVVAIAAAILMFVVVFALSGLR